jgi:glutamine synthetase adenylyltransferase
MKKAYPIFTKMSTQQNVKSELISISSRFLKEYPQFFDKALSVYEMFVEEQTEEIAQAYGLSFIKLPKEHFEKLIPFLRKYARNHLLLQILL